MTPEYVTLLANSAAYWGAIYHSNRDWTRNKSRCKKQELLLLARALGLLTLANTLLMSRRHTSSLKSLVQYLPMETAKRSAKLMKGRSLETDGLATPERNVAYFSCRLTT